MADCLDGAHPGVQTALGAGAAPRCWAGVPTVRVPAGWWAPAAAPHPPEEAARVVPWASPRAPGGGTAVLRRGRAGHRATWWAAALRLVGLAWDTARRLGAVTTDPARRPADSTRSLLTNLPHPAAPHAATAPFTPATRAEIARRYGLRTWVEQGYQQVKQALGWADWQVRADRASRRHWALVCGAFSCCWWAWSRAPDDRTGPTGTADADQPVPVASPGRGNNLADRRTARRPAERALAGGAAARPGLAPPLDPALALVARLVGAAPAPAAPGAA